MNFPENISYSEDHEWIAVDGTEARIGITDYAQRELGDIVFVDVPELNITLAKGEEFGSIERLQFLRSTRLPR